MTDRLEQRVVELYGRGLSTRGVARELNIAKTTVLRVLKSRGVRLRPQGVRYQPQAPRRGS